MFAARQRPCVRPELDDEPLYRAIQAIRPRQQMHGLGTDRSHAIWEPVAELLRETGADWDRRVHRVSVLADALPPAVVDGWINRRAGDRDALAVHAYRTRTEDACLDAATAYPDDPTPWIAMLAQRRVSRSTADVPEIWKQIITRDPLNRTAHHEMLLHLSPRCCGESSFDMRDFAQQCAQETPYGSPLSILPLAARVENYAYRLGLGKHRDAPDLSGHWYGPTVAREIDSVLDRWFRTRAPQHAQAVADLNILAFALVMTQQTARAEAVFQRLGRHMTSFPWSTGNDPVGTFAYWQRRARRS